MAERQSIILKNPTTEQLRHYPIPSRFLETADINIFSVKNNCNYLARHQKEGCCVIVATNEGNLNNLNEIVERIERRVTGGTWNGHAHYNGHNVLADSISLPWFYSWTFGFNNRSMAQLALDYQREFGHVHITRVEYSNVPAKMAENPWVRPLLAAQ